MWGAALLCAGAGPAMLGAQAASCPHGRVVDATGAATVDVTVEMRRGTADAVVETAVSDAAGVFAFRCTTPMGDDAVLRVRARGLDSGAVRAAEGEMVLTLRPTALEQHAEATATRAGVGLGEQAETVDALSSAELTQYPSLTLDESLRQHAGFELFRRASSYISNPTSQGISLRGLGSTAASRTLVLLDEAPLNDPFGGWIHWNEFAPEAVEAVTIATGGGSDLYGSSALGGVIDVVPVRPAVTGASVGVSAAGEDTRDAHGQLGLAQGRWSELGSGQEFRTAGYIPVAPELSGPIDRPANVHFENGRVGTARETGAAGRAFVNGNLLNEARNNGTELQTNGTRLWRWTAGDDWGAGQRSTGRVRVFGGDEGYRQSFSSINSTRSIETLTRLQRVHTEEVGGSADGEAHWSRVAVVAGADVRDLRATDLEQPVLGGGGVGTVQDISARQRFVGGFGELLTEHGRWSGAASLRVDGARNLDTRTLAIAPGGAVTPTPVADRNEVVLDPRLGLVRGLPRGFQVHAAGFRAFRTPTLNELYRTGQVGQEITEANAQLRSERATGAEGGAAWRSTSGYFTLHGNYFWTAINRPVSAVLIASTPTTITNLRENLGQIVSQGLETEAQVGEGRRISGTIGYQYAHATVTRFSAQPALVGLRIPQVPRQSLTAQLRVVSARWGTLVVADRASGLSYDDSSNLFPLRRFNQLDLYAERSLGRGFAGFVAVQNVLHQRADVARTPILTLGTPVLAQGGLRFVWPARQ